MSRAYSGMEISYCKPYTIWTYSNGDKVWLYDGKCHREDGPAFEKANGASNPSR